MKEGGFLGILSGIAILIFLKIGEGIDDTIEGTFSSE
jgi:hypothetical protein